jgi:hypothetical protein
MPSRRFLLLAAVLVALNTALWLVPQGLALQRLAVPSLFGKNMVRAEVIENSGADWRIDRGIVVSNTATLLTIQETDTKIQPIVVGPSTKVTANGSPFKLKKIRQGWRVLVVWPNRGGRPAVSVAIERRHAAPRGSG